MGKPTFVFSLGAWVVPSVFDATRSHLESLGFSTACPAHPSIGAEPPSMTLEDDVQSLRGVLTAYVDEGRDVIVVAHSYGGVVASSAVEGLTKTARTADESSGVTKVIYLAAFALDKGQSLLGILGGNYLPWMKVEVGPFNVPLSFSICKLYRLKIRYWRWSDFIVKKIEHGTDGLEKN